MINITEAVVNMTVKINIGNYSSIEAFMSVKSSVAEGDNYDQIMIHLRKMVRRQIMLEFGELVNTRLLAIPAEQRREWILKNRDMVDSFNTAFPELNGLWREQREALEALQQMTANFSFDEE